MGNKAIFKYLPEQRWVVKADFGFVKLMIHENLKNTLSLRGWITKYAGKALRKRGEGDLFRIFPV